jgi:hypothetical protein
MRPQPETTIRRVGLQATAEIYLKNVAVYADGFVLDYEIAFLPDDVDPAEIRRVTRDAINFDQPERIRVYDDQDRYLARHPGTPDTTPPARRLASAIRQAAGRFAGRATPRRGASRISGRHARRDAQR